MNHHKFDNDTNPVFFGHSSQQLFGCLHIPDKTQAKSKVVVICSPIGQEYIRSHRALFQLASRLCQSGFFVLRFDYYGCGDSHGDFEDGSLSIWAGNILTAIEFAMEKSGSDSVCLIGLRLGCNLAFEAAATCKKIDSAVLWEPILNGSQYLKELVESHKDYIHHLLPINKRYFSKASLPDEILGFPMKMDLIKELEAINHIEMQLDSNINALLIRNGENTLTNNDLEQFVQLNPQVELKMIQDHQAWEERIYKRLIPFNTIKYIVQWTNTKPQ